MTARRALRLAGWLLVAAGVVLSGVIVWQLVGTRYVTQAAQSELLETWRAELPASPTAAYQDPTVAAEPQSGAGERAESAAADPAESAAEDPADPATEDRADPADPDGPVAVLEVVRPGGEAPIDGPLAVVDGVGRGDLRRGPGHYPGTAGPGEPGNMAIAGHRTTYGAPFARLDALVPGDEIHLADRRGDRHVYTVVERRIVAPDATWVLAADPLGSGRPTLTLTTCHPRYSNRERLVVFAELAG